MSDQKKKKGWLKTLWSRFQLVSALFIGVIVVFLLIGICSSILGFFSQEPDLNKRPWGITEPIWIIPPSPLESNYVYLRRDDPNTTAFSIPVVVRDVDQNNRLLRKHRVTVNFTIDWRTRRGTWSSTLSANETGTIRVVYRTQKEIKIDQFNKHGDLICKFVVKKF